jgi:hypothetical protein
MARPEGGRDVGLQVGSDRGRECGTKDARPKPEADRRHLPERPVLRLDDEAWRTGGWVVRGLVRRRRRALDVGRPTLEPGSPDDSGRSTWHRAVRLCGFRGLGQKR